MALVTRILDDTFIETRSDDGRFVVRDDGIEFEIGFDALSHKRTYTEGRKIPPPEPEQIQEPIAEPLMPTLDERIADVEAAVCELYEMMEG